MTGAASVERLRNMTTQDNQQKSPECHLRKAFCGSTQQLNQNNAREYRVADLKDRYHGRTWR
jgi:hypothetical protein